MPHSPLAEVVQRDFGNLPARLRVAARWLVDHPLDVALLSMREQARRAGIPAPTMSRVAQRLGFESFDALRDVHAQVLRQPNGFERRARQLLSRQRGRSEASLIADMLAAGERHSQMLAVPEMVLDLERAADVLAQARRVFCLGARSCFAVAFIYHYIRSLIGGDSMLLDGAGGIGLDSLRTLKPNDVVFAVSVHPYTRQTLDAAHFAVARHAAVVAITDSRVSPLAQCSSTTIVVPIDTPSFFHSIAPALAVAEILATLVAVRRGEPALAALAESEEQLGLLGAFAAGPRFPKRRHSRTALGKRDNKRPPAK